MCYRVETVERYEELKTLLSSSHHLADESLINGRKISIFQLSTPINYKGYLITALKLPSPSETFYAEGWEHVEFIVQSLTGFKRRHKNLKFNEKNIDRKINPEISLSFKNCSAKFHERPILEVVVLQRQSGEL